MTERELPTVMGIPARCDGEECWDRLSEKAVLKRKQQHGPLCGQHENGQDSRNDSSQGQQPGLSVESTHHYGLVPRKHAQNLLDASGGKGLDAR